MSIEEQPDPNPLRPRGFLAVHSADSVGDLVEDDQSETIERLRRELDIQSAIIKEQQALLAHSRKIFDRASAVARIGVWECELADESLYWTDGVYDIFEIPRDAPLSREATLACYTPASRQALEFVRTKAIAELGGFELDIEIVTPKGRRRWVRVTATVESEDGKAVRLFGMKQDITDEKTLADRNRYLAEFDIMTGLANRATFQTALAELERSASDGSLSPSALLLIDLDGFKRINDTYGHGVGDETLVEAAARLQAICPKRALAARIGGDEFAVLMKGALSRSAGRLAERIVTAMSEPLVVRGERIALGASVGIAFPHRLDGADLFCSADAALYEAKASGRGTFRVFDTALPSAAPTPKRRRTDR